MAKAKKTDSPGLSLAEIKAQQAAAANAGLPTPAAPITGLHVAMEAFEKAEGKVFGGKGGNLLPLDPGQAAGPLTISTILRNQDIGDSGFDPVDVFVGRAANGSDYQLPISASFMNKAEEAGLGVGDVILIRRQADAIGKKGRAKGKVMKIYDLKLVSQVAKAKPGRKAKTA